MKTEWRVRKEDKQGRQQYMRRAIDAGCASAQYEVGMDYVEGKNGCQKDIHRATDMFIASAEQGNADAQYELAKCYRGGWGLFRSYLKAYTWYSKAAEQGHFEAQQEKDRMLSLGRVRPLGLIEHIQFIFTVQRRNKMKTMNKLKNISMVVLCACTVLGSGKAHAGNTHTLLSADEIATRIEGSRPKALMTSYSLKALNEAAFIQAHIKYKELQIDLLDLQHIKRTNPEKRGEVTLQIALKKEQLELKALEIKNYIYYVRRFK